MGAMAEMAQREQQAWECQQRWVTTPSFVAGDTVEIISGAFAGLEAVFEGQINDKERVSILLTILGRVTRVNINLDMLVRPA